MGAGQGIPGASHRDRIDFQTNDAGQPEARVEIYVAKVKGGVTTQPGAFVFGPLKVGQAFEGTVEIVDPAEEPREVREVKVEDPRLNVQFLKIKPERRNSGPGRSEWRIGTLLIRGDTSMPCSLQQTVKIWVEGRVHPDLLSITGHVVSPVVFVPERLSLPRNSRSGQIFEASCSCQGSGEEKFQLVVVDLPQGFKVEGLILASQSRAMS